MIRVDTVAREFGVGGGVAVALPVAGGVPLPAAGFGGEEEVPA